jgi:hypothetical protein
MAETSTDSLAQRFDRAVASLPPTSLARAIAPQLRRPILMAPDTMRKELLTLLRLASEVFELTEEEIRAAIRARSGPGA